MMPYPITAEVRIVDVKSFIPWVAPMTVDRVLHRFLSE